MPPPRVISASYELTLADYQSASWLHLRPRKVIGAAGGLIVLLAAAALGFGGYSLLRPGRHGALVAALAAPLGYFALFFYATLPRLVTRSYLRQPALHAMVHLEVTVAGIRSRTPRGRRSFQWEDLTGWKAGSQTTLVYAADKRFIIFPARAFASEQDFRALADQLKAKLGPPRP